MKEEACLEINKKAHYESHDEEAPLKEKEKDRDSNYTRKREEHKIR
jgi:hypothetical protein